MFQSVVSVATSLSSPLNALQLFLSVGFISARGGSVVGSAHRFEVEHHQTKASVKEDHGYLPADL